MSTGLPAEKFEKPSYLANEPAYDTKYLSQYCQPPRMKVIQALSGPPFKPPYKDGDVIIVPQMEKIGDFETPFVLTPIYFFSDFCCLNPVGMRGQLPFIRERTFDHNSTIAKKAKAFVKEPCPEAKDQQIKYVQNLNWMCIVHHEDFAELPIAFVFNRGSFKVGQAMNGVIQARRDAPPYSMRLRALCKMIPGKPPTNFPGLDIKNDPEPWVTDEQYPRYKKLAADLEELVNAGKMDIDLDDTDVGEDAANESKF